MKRLSKSLLLSIILIVVCFWFINTKIINDSESQVALNDCQGRLYKGAWFDVMVPEGFEPNQSMPSTTGQGYDSVWFINNELGLEFYLYAPQWGGDPDDLLNDPNSIEIIESLDADNDITTNRLSISYKNGKQGSFNSEESTAYISHLTTGYRAQEIPLSANSEHIFNCFKNSIQQYTD